MGWRDKVTATRLQRLGLAVLLAFLGLYTVFIVVFSAWQERSVPAAWLVNLPEAVFAFPLAALFWAGVAAWVFGWWLAHRR